MNLSKVTDRTFRLLHDDERRLVKYMSLETDCRLVMLKQLTLSKYFRLLEGESKENEVLLLDYMNTNARVIMLITELKADFLSNTRVDFEERIKEIKQLYKRLGEMQNDIVSVVSKNMIVSEHDKEVLDRKFNY